MLKCLRRVHFRLRSSSTSSATQDAPHIRRLSAFGKNDTLFQAVALVFCQLPLVLETAHDDPRSDLLLFCKLHDGTKIESSTPRELHPRRRWNQVVLRPNVGLLFPWIIGPLDLHKRFFVTVEENVRRLVKEGEPKQIVRLSPQGKLDKRLGRAQPAGGSRCP